MCFICLFAQIWLVQYKTCNTQLCKNKNIFYAYVAVCCTMLWNRCIFMFTSLCNSTTQDLASKRLVQGGTCMRVCAVFDKEISTVWVCVLCVVSKRLVWECAMCDLRQSCESVSRNMSLACITRALLRPFLAFAYCTFNSIAPCACHQALYFCYKY